jgi:hypothetical protein
LRSGGAQITGSQSSNTNSTTNSSTPDPIGKALITNVEMDDALPPIPSMYFQQTAKNGVELNMKRTSSLMSSASNPTQSTYISPMQQRLLPPLPLVPPPQPLLYDFKSPTTLG